MVPHKTFTLCGTPEFLAPEVLLGRGYGAAVDWWALGVLVYEIVVGRNPFVDPFADGGEGATLRNVLHAPLSFSPRFDPACRDLIARLLCRFPLQRLGSGVDGRQQVHDHRFFKRLNMAALLQQRVPAPWVPPLKDNMDRSHFALQAEPSAEPDDPATIALVDRTNWEVWDYFNAHDGDDGGGGGGDGGGGRAAAAEAGAKPPGTQIAVVINDEDAERGGGVDARPACSPGCAFPWRGEPESAFCEATSAVLAYRNSARSEAGGAPSSADGLCYASSTTEVK